MSPDEVRGRYERIRAEVGAGVTIVAATKYVSVEELAVFAEAGIDVVGENRAQDRNAVIEQRVAPCAAAGIAERAAQR